MIPRSDTDSKLWFERLYNKLGLPFWAGVIIIGFLPTLILTLVGYYSYNVKTDFTGEISLGVPLLLANIVYVLFSCRYIRRRVDDLEKYSVTMGAEQSNIKTGYLSNFRPVLVTWIVLLASSILVLEPIFNPGYSPLQKCPQRASIQLLPIAPSDFPLGLPIINDRNLQDGPPPAQAQDLH